MLADSINIISAVIIVAIIALWLLGLWLAPDEPADELREERSLRTDDV